jgi:hypothetical protein
MKSIPTVNPIQKKVVVVVGIGIGSAALLVLKIIISLTLIKKIRKNQD